MGYKRRYLSGQDAQTVDLGERSVTADKIAPGAVDTEELAPDSVTGEKILDGTIDSADLKDGAVTTPKIVDAGVTTEKIADEAITAAKINPASGIPVRPLSPGLATAEIADSAVTAAKLGAEAAETSKIKDGAVSTDKVAHDAITEDKIADSAVEAEHIQNGAVVAGKLGNNSVVETNIVDGTVTHDKIGVGAVAGDRVADLGIDPGKLDYLSVAEENIQTAALALRHLESYHVRDVDLSEDFRGVDVSNRWRKLLNYDSYIITTEKGVKLISPSNASGWHCQMDYDSKGIVGYGGKLLLSFVIPVIAEPLNYRNVKLGLCRVSDAAAFIWFQANDNAGAVPNWYAWCADGGPTDNADTGIPIVAGPQILGIEWNSPTNIRFYIDGIQVAELTTNIPNDSILDPFMFCASHTSSIRDLTVSVMSLQKLRELP